MSIKIPLSSPDIGPLEAKYLNEALQSGWVGSKGDFVTRFEEGFARYLGVKHAITCSNGTSAIHLAIMGANVGPESRVFVSQNTFRAPIHMALLTSSKVQACLWDKKTWNIDLRGLDKEEGYLIGVHLYGNPIDLGKKLNLTLIEDCAQALGCEYEKKKLGTFGLVSSFSFHSAKTVTTGEGGMVCTDNDQVAERVRLLRSHAMTEPYNHAGIGFNYRLTNLQCAIGCAQLERIEELTEKKRQITEWYDFYLSHRFQRQKIQNGARVVKWVNTYRTQNAQLVRSVLAEKGIETRPGYVGHDFISFPSSTKLTQDQVKLICKEANDVA